MSGSPAYDVNITDIIPSGLKLISATPTPNSSFANGVFWNFPVLPVGGIKNLSYIVTVNSSITAGEVLQNRAIATWSSTTGPNPDERFGNYTTLDNYNRSANYPITAKTQSGLIKLPDPTRIALVGKQVNYSINVELPLANALQVWVNDTLPSGLIYLPGTLVVTGASTNPVETVSVPNDGTQPVIISWFFGDVNNTTGLGIQIEFNASVANITANRAGRTISNNTAALKWTDFYGETHAVSDQSGLVEVPGIKVSKNPVPSEGSTSTNVNFTISVTNTGHVMLNHVAVVDVLPAGLNLVSANRTYTVTGNAITWNDIGSLNASETKYIWLKAHINGIVLGDLINQINATGKLPSDENITNSSTALVHALYSAINVTKKAEPSSGAPSTNVDFSINVTNTGNVRLDHIRVVDTLPIGLNYVSSNRSGISSGQTVTWSDIGSLEPGNSTYLDLVAHINGQAYGDLVNLINTTGQPPTGNNVTSQSTENVTAETASISITKNAEPSSGAPSTNVDFSINVTNTGNVRLDHIRVVDTLPIGLNYVSSNRSGVSSGQSVTWSDIGSLEPGNSTYLDLVAHINGQAYGDLVNLINTTGQPPTGNNVTSQSTENVTAETASISITKNAEPSSGAPSTNVDFIINVTNTGNVRLDHIRVVDTLPVGLNYVSSNRSGVSSGQTVTWSDIGSLEPGNSTYLDLVAHINGQAYGDLVNLINTTGQPPTGNNVTSQSTENVTAETASISITKNAEPSSGAPSTNVDFSINVTNTGNVRLDHIRVVDTLPIGLNYVSSNRSGVSSGQTVTWSDIGSLEPGNSTYLDLVAHINGQAYGELVNRINTTGQPPTGNNVTSQSTENVTAETASISITKKASSSSGVTGTNVDFIINVTNTGNVRLDHIRVVDTLPVGLSYLSSNPSGISSGQSVTWADIGSLEPGNSTYLDLVARIDGNAYGSLNNHVNVTAEPLTGANITSDDTAMVRARAVADMSNAIPESVQFEQFCDAETIAGSGIIDVSTSVIDKRIALDYSNVMAGEGDLEMDSERAFSEKAGNLKRNVTNETMPLNLFEDTKMSYSGPTPLVGGKNLRSVEFYGGIGAEISEDFSVNELEKEQTLFFASTDPGSQVENLSLAADLRNESPVHLVGANTKNAFNGTWGMQSKWHEILQKDIKSSQVFSGRFEAEKTIKFHEAPVKGDTKKACEGIDC